MGMTILPLGAPSDEPVSTDKKERAPRKKAGWLQSNSEEKGEKRPSNPPLNEISQQVHQLYGDTLKYSENQGSFYIYEYRSAGLWSHLSDVEMKGSIKDKLDFLGTSSLPRGYGMNTINDVMEQLRVSTIHEEWYEGNDYLLFTNGILDVNTRQLSGFDQEMYMTQQLPYDYDPSATCEPIIKWLKNAQDNTWGRVQVLRSWLRAVLLSHSEIQKFVEIVGPGKSGKSTYANLAHALVIREPRARVGWG
jgi:putative DNA primase/helicase